MKSMLPKQKSYIPRFALIINTIWSAFDDSFKIGIVKTDSLLRAENLSSYFINMSKLVKHDVKEKNNLKQIARMAGSNTYDQFLAMYTANPNMNRTTASEILEVSRRTIQNWVKKLEKE